MAELDPLFLALQEAVAGRYSLERELGRGGMGVVYLARDVSLDRLVAIKLLPPELAARATLRERFLREARLAARLSHPNIVPIHSVEEHDGLVWFVMAFVPGESLGARLRARGSLPPSEAGRLLRDVAWALGHAHAHGVVHRDVKPDNILLESGGRRALIADFGIAAPVDQGGEIVGTVAYLSPEQATGERVDGRSDIYALGVVAYYALSGRLPYPVTTLDALIERQLAGAPPPLASVAAHVPRALSRQIDRCLAPLPTARFQTGEELAGALDEVSVAPSELPAPLRVWLTKGNQSRGALGLWSLLAGLPAGATIVAMLASGMPDITGAVISTVIVLGAPWVVYLGARLVHTRKVLAAGYSPGDLLLAIREHAERRREELAFEIGKPPSALGRLLRRLTWGAFIGAIGSVVLLPLVGSRLPSILYFWLTLAGVAVGGGILGLFIPGREIPVRDRVSTWRERFWAGPIGRTITDIAGWRLGRRSAPEQTLHRPTELALGDAAEALFRALPAGERRDLKQLPEQIKLLSEQAQHMRGKLEELDDLIAQAAPTTLFEGEKAAGDGGAGALGEARSLWAARLKETVTMLESLRLGLLKLHAGTATPETLTEDLAAAHELRERLGLLLNAHHEADDLLGRRDG